MICAFFLQTDLFCGGRQSLHLISTRYAVMGFVLQGKTILKGAGTWWIHFLVRFIIGDSLNTSRYLVYKPGEHGISRGSFRNEEECSSPSHSWLWALLGINKKVKCFPDVVFSCHGNVHTSHCQHLYTAPQTSYFCLQELFIVRPRSHSVLNGARVISASCSNAPSQLDTLRLAALQLDTGSRSLWTFSFLVPGGHFMSSLLKACCSACCHLNGAKESSLAASWLLRPSPHPHPPVLLGLQDPGQGFSWCVGTPAVNSKRYFMLPSWFTLTHLIRGCWKIKMPIYVFTIRNILAKQ